jgi:hypothetical protein
MAQSHATGRHTEQRGGMEAVASVASDNTLHFAPVRRTDRTGAGEGEGDPGEAETARHPVSERVSGDAAAGPGSG